MYNPNAPSIARFRRRMIGLFHNTMQRCFVENWDEKVRLIKQQNANSRDLKSFATYVLRYTADDNCSSIDTIFAEIDRSGKDVIDDFEEIVLADRKPLDLVVRYVVGHISTDSELFNMLMIKSRLLLSNFGLASILFEKDIEKKIRRSCTIVGGDNMKTFYPKYTSKEEMLSRCRQTGGNGLLLPEFIIENLNEFRSMSNASRWCFRIEIVLWTILVTITIYLGVLLSQTKVHLSTNTILFIYNILQSNTVFIASFAILFSGLFCDKEFSQTLKYVTYGDPRKSSMFV